MDKEALNGFKELLAEGLKTVAAPGLHVKAKKLALGFSAAGPKQPEAEINLVFLARVDGVYLTSHVTDGRLARAVQSLGLPPKANNLLAKGLYFHTTLSEKNREFSPDQGGARLLYSGMPMETVRDEILARLRDRYLPVIIAILTLSDDLPSIIERHAGDFSYPLACLALLEKAGRTDRYSSIRSSPELKSKYGKEKDFDFDALLPSVTL